MVLLGLQLILLPVYDTAVQTPVPNEHDDKAYFLVDIASPHSKTKCEYFIHIL